MEGHEEAAEARQGHPGAFCGHLEGGICTLVGFPVPESMCTHCQQDSTGLFRAGLASHQAKQELKARLAGVITHFPCARYGLEVDDLFCTECRQNPALKQALGARRATTARRGSPCLRRREQAGEVEVRCCGGRTRMVPAYRCEGDLEKKTEQDCLRCGDYQPAEPAKPEVPSCASWPDLWQVHQGKTALILACGPSVLLPGEDPTPETVNPRQVQTDFVVSTNWAWKWYEDICDYQVSYDPAPCVGWRPGRVKLLTPLRRQDVTRTLEHCHPYCLFPACDYGEIAQGKGLPCSRNSGYAALAFAAYAGAKAIKVLGMDFGPRNGRMHFYHETAFDVDRRVKSFGRQKERVQTDLGKLLGVVRATGATVENLSPQSELDWS